MRDLRTHVLCTPAGRASRILLVASAGMDEGKSLVATNLAAGLARVGHRVLLIDLDLRKPSLHTMFGLPLQPGLSDLLSNGSNGGGSRGHPAPTDVRDLWVLPAGRARANPGDLIGSPFRRLIQSLPESFDRIVLDSPPVMAVTDTSLHRARRGRRDLRRQRRSHGSPEKLRRRRSNGSTPWARGSWGRCSIRVDLGGTVRRSTCNA